MPDRRSRAGLGSVGRESSVREPRWRVGAQVEARGGVLRPRERAPRVIGQAVSPVSGGCDDLAGFAKSEAFAVKLHRGNAGLNYRSVLAFEVGPVEAELYRCPAHRRG